VTKFIVTIIKFIGLTPVCVGCILYHPVYNRTSCSNYRWPFCITFLRHRYRSTFRLSFHPSSQFRDCWSTLSVLGPKLVFGRGSLLHPIKRLCHRSWRSFNKSIKKV